MSYGIPASEDGCKHKFITIQNLKKNILLSVNLAEIAKLMESYAVHVQE